MSLFDKIQATLADIFSNFDSQQALTVKQNITEALPNLTAPAHQLLILMKDKNIKFDEFLADKCLPLLRFYLAPTAMQQAIFLSQSQLTQFFSLIPVVEAYVLKEKITLTLHLLERRDDSSVVPFPPSDDRLRIAESAKLKELQKSFHSTKTCAYLDCFYQLEAGKLQIADSQQNFHQNMILYSELSPLQQLEAQALVKQSKNVASA